MCALFSPEILQARVVKGLSKTRSESPTVRVSNTRYTMNSSTGASVALT